MNDRTGARTGKIPAAPLLAETKPGTKLHTDQKVPAASNDKIRPCRIRAEISGKSRISTLYKNQSKPICQRLFSKDQPSACSKADWVKRCMPIDFSDYLRVAGSLPARPETPCDYPGPVAQG